MMKYQCITLWLFCIFCSGFSQGRERIGGNPDDGAKIERPCPTYDLNCIRLFFQKHAHCKKMAGPVPDPVSRPQSNIYIPRVNLTLSIVDQRVGGLNGRIEEFYINRETDKLVLAVEFMNMSQASDKTYFKFHRPAKEPVITTTSYVAAFAPLIITAVIPNIEDLQLHEAECTTFLTAPVAPFAVTPSAVASTDPQAAMGIVVANLDQAVDMQEIFLTDSTYFIATYIQYNICDFGLFLT